MKKIKFSKLQASGNDFILIDALSTKAKKSTQFYKNFAKKYCPRATGIGADGLLLIERSKKALFKMRIFNPDGSEVDMCGNGARCSVLWASSETRKKNIEFETRAGIIKSEVKNNNVRIQITEPRKARLNIPLKILGHKVRVNYINTGVPHVIIFVQGLDKINVQAIGEAVRFHKEFSPAGTNVDFVEVLGKDFIKVRTYERGVELETLACGTGVIASAVISSFALGIKCAKNKFKVLTKSGDSLKVSFNSCGSKIDDVWLEGGANFVYKGEIIY